MWNIVTWGKERHSFKPTMLLKNFKKKSWHPFAHPILLENRLMKSSPAYHVIHWVLHLLPCKGHSNKVP